MKTRSLPDYFRFKTDEKWMMIFFSFSSFLLENVTRHDDIHDVISLKLSSFNNVDSIPTDFHWIQLMNRFSVVYVSSTRNVH